jgi:polyisoprenoid-binding protein YceI
MSPVKTGLLEFSIDAKASLLTVQAFASGIAAVVAHSPKFAIRNFLGTAGFAPDAPEGSSLDLTLMLNSLDLLDEVRTTERREIERVMFGEVLEINRYPTIEFKSSHIRSANISPNMYRMSIQGELTLHGTTQGTKIDTQVMVGEDNLKAQGTFSIMQSDFGITIATVAGGSLKLKDELKCAYFISARRER